MTQDLLSIADMIELRARFGQPLTLSEMQEVAKQLRSIANPPPRFPVIPGGRGDAA